MFTLPLFEGPRSHDAANDAANALEPIQNMPQSAFWRKVTLAQGRRATRFDDPRYTFLFPTAYGTIQVALRAGENPTGISAVSFMVLISTTETLLVCSLAT